MYDDLVFNPAAYAAVIAKQDAQGHKGNGYHNGEHRAKRAEKTYSGYYDHSKGYGKLWDSVKDWRESCEW